MLEQDEAAEANLNALMKSASDALADLKSQIEILAGLEQLDPYLVAIAASYVQRFANQAKFFDRLAHILTAANQN